MLVLLLCRSIVPYIRKFGKHPVTGALLKQEDLIPLTFHKNSDGVCLLTLLLYIDVYEFCIDWIELMELELCLYWKMRDKSHKLS